MLGDEALFGVGLFTNMIAFLNCGEEIVNRLSKF